jgi:hypothetical protein
VRVLFRPDDRAQQRVFTHRTTRTHVGRATTVVCPLASQPLHVADRARIGGQGFDRQRRIFAQQL